MRISSVGRNTNGTIIRKVVFLFEKDYALKEETYIL
jgi:hypothetical protein